ncbi:MAG: hypothetical protein ACJAZ1_001610 [Yoonia sp.]|jgi:hypothetical protein
MQNTTLRRAEMDEQALADPFMYAMASRAADITSMVRDALLAGRAQLAFHPIVTADGHQKIAFHEGLVRLTDETGQIIPARSTGAAAFGERFGTANR